MHFGVVGGLDRSARHYEQIARESGHSLECHTGDLAGTGPGTLETLIQRAEVLLVVTDMNSHGAVWQTRRLARRYGRRVVFVRRLGVARLRALFTSEGGGACS